MAASKGKKKQWHERRAEQKLRSRRILGEKQKRMRAQAERKKEREQLMSEKQKINKDINGVSGATISSRCAVFAVKKAIVLYEELDNVGIITCLGLDEAVELFICARLLLCNLTTIACKFASLAVTLTRI